MHPSRKIAGVTVAVAALLGSAATASAATAAPAASNACSSAASGTCGAEVNVFGNAFYAQQQSSATNTKVIAYPNSTKNGSDFNAVQSGGANTRQFEYAPNDKLSGKCISEPSGVARSGLVLRPCRAASSSLVSFQQFTGVDVTDTSGTQWTNVASGLKVQANGTGAQLIAVSTVTNPGGSYWGWNQDAVIPSTTYVKSGSYTFASNSDNVWQISYKPVDLADASQTLGASGVTVSTAASSYADSGVIVDLGTLDSLFSSGSYVPPTIVDSGPVGVNYYFDTDGNGGFLSFSSNGIYEGPGGDNLASISGDSADFGTFTQGNTSIGLSGTLTMEQVLAAYQARTSGTTDPEVWAWIGVSGGTAQTGTVTSVDGTALVKASS